MALPIVKSELRIYTRQQKVLLSDIEAAIDQDDVKAWEWDEGIGCYFNKAEPYYHQSGLTPVIESGVLIFRLAWPNGKDYDPDLAGVMFGQFIQMLVTHFPSYLDRIEIV
jgi:hypothetical protein